MIVGTWMFLSFLSFSIGTLDDALRIYAHASGYMTLGGPV